jgi:hypothetical protein
LRRMHNDHARAQDRARPRRRLFDEVALSV